MRNREIRTVRRVTALTIGVAVLAVWLSACRHEPIPERAALPRAALPRTYQLVVSSSPDRSGAVALSGRRLRGRVYVFVPSDAGVARARFFLDSASPSRPPYHTQAPAPFDLAGSRPDGAARPFDTTVLRNGRHTVTALLGLSDGGSATAQASFSVSNPARASPTTRATTTTAATATREPQPAPPRLLFGLGPEANGARSARLARQAPVRMLTSWYNGPGDLAWMVGWKDSLVPQAYADGYAMHLIVWTGDAEGSISTPYGTACGRRYPLSSRFPDDMRRLARIFAGAANGPRLYVSLFTEFQTYPCTDNAWNASREVNAYYRALKDRYREAAATFHQQAPNARVSLSWGGWQTRWDDPATGAGRSLFQHFADVLRASDFQSFQAMATDSNVRDIRAMVRTLGVYGPVMLAHYQPDNGSKAVLQADLHAILSDGYLEDVTRDGLFAMSFMDANSLAAPSDLYDFVRRAVQRYARAPA
jgi:hypothetical protein